MPISNIDIANALEKMATFLESQGDNPYRVRAYRKAANSILKWQNELAMMVANEEALTAIPYIGEKIANLLQKALLKNDISLLSNHATKRKTPLKIQPTIKTSKKKPSYRLHHLMPIIESLLLQIKSIPGVTQAEAAGDYRRRCELVEKAAIVVESNDVASVLAQLRLLTCIQSIAKCSTRSFILTLTAGAKINLSIHRPLTFPFVLLHQTGSTKHVAALTKLAEANTWHLLESGLYKNKKRVPATSEQAIYHQLKLAYIPPELREDQGEIQAALANQLPTLVELSDIRGNLHAHTRETDGIETLETMVNEGIKFGYEYMAITDHSQSLKITNGLDEKRLWAQIKLIDQLNARLKTIRILKATEVDILEDGSLDFSNDILKELDIRVCAIHSKFRLPKQVQTERVLRAMDNPYFNIFAHPTGRLIKKRQPYELDMDVILKHAKASNCFLELNAQPYRLDINADYARKAKEYGVKVSIATDAHSKVGFTYMQFGIAQARRGWLEASDVINTLPLEKLLQLIKR